MRCLYFVLFILKKKLENLFYPILCYDFWRIYWTRTLIYMKAVKEVLCWIICRSWIAMVQGLFYVDTILILSVYMVYCLRFILIFGPLLLRRSFVVPLALLFFVLLILSCICTKYCVLIVLWFVRLRFKVLRVLYLFW